MTEEEKKKSIPLYTLCFDDTVEYCDFYFEKRLPHNEVAVCEEDEQIKGMIHLISKQIVCGNSLETCCYLYAVATNPQFRRQGVMGRILAKILRDLSQKGDGFTYLIPSSEENAEIYQKYGFARVMDKCEYCSDLGKESFAGNQQRCGSNEDLSKKTLQVRLAAQEDLDALSYFAEKVMAESYAVYISKDRQYFKNIMELMEADGGEVLLYLMDGQIKGYRLGTDEDVLEEVRENLGLEAVRTTPYAMARILNIPKLLNQIGTNAEGCIYIEVTDSIIEDNNGVFLWEYASKGSKWEKISHKVDVKVTIEKFAGHLFGYAAIAGLPPMNTKQGFYINDYV